MMGEGRNLVALWGASVLLCGVLYCSKPGSRKRTCPCLSFPVVKPNASFRGSLIDVVGRIATGLQARTTMHEISRGG